MPEIIMKLIANQKLAKEPKDSSGFVDLNDGKGPLQVFRGDRVKTGAQDAVTETVGDRKIRWVFVEALEVDASGDKVDNAAKKKGFVSDRFLVAEAIAVSMSGGIQLFAEAVDKSVFAEACYVQAALNKTNPAYLYALAFALSGNEWTSTEVQTSDPAGAFRIPQETWDALLDEPEAAGFKPDQIKFPNAQCVVAAIIAAKSASLLEGRITDRGLSGVDLFLAHMFVDTKSIADKSCGAKAAAAILQAEAVDAKVKSGLVIRENIYPDDAERIAFLKRNFDIFGVDGSASIEEALASCAKKLDSGFTEALKIADELQDEEGCEISLFIDSIPSKPNDPISGPNSYNEDGAGTGQGGGGVIESQKKAVRCLPISQSLHDILEYAGRKTGLNVEVYSGGQPATGPHRVGSKRHDVGDGRVGAADLYMRDAITKHLLDSTNPADRARIAKYIEEAAAAGATGIGHAPNYMGPKSTHIGGGEPVTAWGTGGKRAGAPDWVIEAFERGRSQPLTSKQVAQSLKEMRDTDHSSAPGGFDVPPHAGGSSVKATGKQPRAASSATDAAIVEAANTFHFDPNTFRAIASIESDMTPESNRNRPTQYKGLYQIGREEWQQFGEGGEIFSARDNAMAFGRMTRHHAQRFKAKYGRYPTDTESYLIHQQGLGFYTIGAMTNINGNPYPGMKGPQTHESFEKGWGRELLRRKAWFAKGEATETSAGEV